MNVNDDPETLVDTCPVCGTGELVLQYGGMDKIVYWQCDNPNCKAVLDQYDMIRLEMEQRNDNHTP